MGKEDLYLTAETVIRISPYFNSNRQLTIYSDQEIASPDTLLTASQALSQLRHKPA